jgi:hypothetical protein
MRIKTGKPIWALALTAAALAFVILFALLPPSTKSRYDQIRAGMTQAEVEAAFGRAGTAARPENTTGRYLPTAREQFDPAYPGGADRERYWLAPDGMVVVEFGPDGGVTGKTFLRRAGH